jgi:hypothetical protein
MHELLVRPIRYDVPSAVEGEVITEFFSHPDEAAANESDQPALEQKLWPPRPTDRMATEQWVEKKEDQSLADDVPECAARSDPLPPEHLVRRHHDLFGCRHSQDPSFDSRGAAARPTGSFGWAEG